MGIDGSVGMDEKLFFESHSEIKSDVIRVRFERKCEKVDFKFDIKLNHVLKCKSKFTAHDENFDCLVGHEKFLVCF